MQALPPMTCTHAAGKEPQAVLTRVRINILDEHDSCFGPKLLDKGAQSSLVGSICRPLAR